MSQTFRPLLDALKKRGADPQAVDGAAEEAMRTGRSIRDVLINDRIVDETELTEASANAYGINSVDLVGCPIDAAAMAKIPLSIVLRHRVLGLAVDEDEIVVGITDPTDVVALDDVRAATGLIVRPVVVARSELRKIIDRLQRGDRPRRHRREPARRGGPDPRPAHHAGRRLDQRQPDLLRRRRRRRSAPARPGRPPASSWSSASSAAAWT